MTKKELEARNEELEMQRLLIEAKIIAHAQADSSVRDLQASLEQEGLMRYQGVPR